MKNKISILLIFIGFLSFLFSCEKDETKIMLIESPVNPTIKALPSLTLTRDKGTDTLIFTGTSVNPGFKASATYFLEACAQGNNFADAVVIYSGVQDSVIKVKSSDLNGMLLKKFPANEASSVDFRIRAVLVVDAGTGAPGTSAQPFAYSSAVTNANVTIYGLPRLDLLGSGINQIIESALGDGNYIGYVKLDLTKPFTLKDPDLNIIYGSSGADLSINGTNITPLVTGWQKLTVDTKKLTYKLEEYQIGLVGSATANGWNSPDSKMDYNIKEGCWVITTNLTNDQFKFRLNDGWAWNLGGKGTGDGSADNYSDATTIPLAQGGKNIGLTKGAGNYTIKLFITESKATVVKN